MKFYKSYDKQLIECKRTENSFIVDPPLGEYKILICGKYKDWCSPILCEDIRRKEGEE